MHRAKIFLDDIAVKGVQTFRLMHNGSPRKLGPLYPPRQFEKRRIKGGGVIAGRKIPLKRHSGKS